MVAPLVLALRQKLAVLKRKRPRPSLDRFDRFFWTTLRYIWPRWSDVLVIVKPKAAVGWHRAAFACTGRRRSRPRGGRPKVNEEIRKIGCEVSERTVARYLQSLRRRGDIVLLVI